MVREKKLRVIDANLLFFIGALIFLSGGAYFQHRELVSGLIITQLGVVLAPPLLYLIIRKINIKKALRINKISLKHGILVGMITLLMYPVAVVANAIIMLLLSLMGNINVPQIPMPENTNEYVIMMLVVSLLAGFCEEVLFRGFVLSGYEPMGKKKAIIFSALLFGFFHFNIYNLAGPVVLGLVFGYLVILTDSLWAGVIGHMVNNGFAITLSFIINYLSDILSLNEATTVETPEVSTTIALLVSLITIGVIAIVTSMIAYKLVKIIKKDRQAIIENQKEEIIETDQSNVADEKLLNEMNKTYPIEFFPLYLTAPLYVWMAGSQILRIIRMG
ncbi:type II CAAX endopeptidase family protein [Alkaliphilus transvaalensis]|uniref:type II CAAX endopeptidase family protein n=1 Tax=Alkaliphilus transvaalensis TaxID=114628 RepID=UPI00047A70A7|nr:type II CAAX endopeptidase family protein [Alkaliphilus transvaalensis]